MIIKLQRHEFSKKDEIVREKQAEGYTLINISEGFESLSSGSGGTQSTPSITLEFKKI